MKTENKNTHMPMQVAMFFLNTTDCATSHSAFLIAASTSGVKGLSGLGTGGSGSLDKLQAITMLPTVSHSQLRPIVVKQVTSNSLHSFHSFGV